MRADDFTSMEVLVSQYKGDIQEFVTYIKTVNKSTNNVRFSPVVTNRIVAVLHHFIQAATCFHTIPDMQSVTRAYATDLVDSYTMYRQFKDEDADEEVIVDLPVLKGHENWVQYRDKFLSNLSNISGSNGTPLSYVVDSNPRVATSRHDLYTETQTMTIDSWE